jgi:periplasmic copper chaperone A
VKRQMLLFALAGVLASSTILAASPQVSITDAWIRALPPPTPAGGYFKLRNDGDSALTLTGASSPACGMLMLHKTETMSGMAHMEEVTDVDVPPHGSVVFAPGGYHLMCMDPRAAIKPGNTVPVTLDLSGGMIVTAPFDVRGATGQ